MRRFEPIWGRTSLVKRRNLHFEKAFESGDLAGLMQLTSSEAHKRDALHLAILANALFGEWTTALMHHRWSETHRLRFTAEQEAAINFALGVGHTRISEYAQARIQFARNFRFRHAAGRAQFFFWQGLGFYRYFSGAYHRSAGYARKALDHATQSKFAYGQLLSEELLAHSLSEAGEVRLGQKHMKRSLSRARLLGHKSLRQSFRLLLLLNEARFGLNWNCIPLLEKALLKLHPKDSYSRNAVKLELANQYILRGLTGRSFEVLDEACDSIYASQNRRQIAQLNFRLAFLTWLRGRRDEALHLLKSAELHLHHEVDIVLWTKMRGLRERILDSTLSSPHASVKKNDSFGEDRVADLYAGVLAKDPKALETVLKMGLHFFLYPYYGLPFGQKALLFDLLPRGVVIVDQGNIAVVEHGFSRLNRRVIEALAASHHSKAELIENVWGYSYEASRHDALIYTSISKIRQLLGPAGVWIEVDEKGYRLQSGVTLKAQESSPVQQPEKAGPAPSRAAKNSTLNFRQLRILDTFDTAKREIVGVDEVMRDFAVSRATATRDLSELTDLGLLLRLGRARATKYTIATKRNTT